jgi:hypothetical protein
MGIVMGQNEDELPEAKKNNDDNKIGNAFVLGPVADQQNTGYK